MSFYYKFKHTVKKITCYGLFLVGYGGLLIADIFLRRKGKSLYFYVLSTHRIGNFSLDVDFYLRKCQLDSDFSRKNVIFISGKNVCNTVLLDLVKRHCKVIGGVSGSILHFMRNWIRKTRFYISLVPENNEYILYQTTRSTLHFEKKENDMGARLLKKHFGIEVGETKYICLFARDQVYLNTMTPGKNWSHHLSRNFDVDTFIPTIEYLINQGFVVIRMGSHVAKRVTFSHPKFFDYPYLSIRSEFLDLFLVMQCYFLIGSASGLCDLTGVFGVPYLAINYTPFLVAPWKGKSLYIPKKITNSQGELLRFYDLFAQSERYIRDVDFYNVGTLEDVYQFNFIDNTAIEIIEATKDMIFYVQNECQLDKPDQELMTVYYRAWAKNTKFSEIKTPLAPSWLKNNLNFYTEQVMLHAHDTSICNAS